MPEERSVGDLLTKKSVTLELTPVEFCILNELSLIGIDTVIGHDASDNLIRLAGIIRVFGAGSKLGVSEVMRGAFDHTMDVYQVVLEQATSEERQALRLSTGMARRNLGLRL